MVVRMAIPNINNLRKFYYRDKLSMQEIAEKYKKSLNCIKYYMDKYGLERRDRSLATYVKLNKKDPFSIKSNLSIEKEKLKLAALMLYWAEGRKGTGRIDISNSDPNVILVFLRFLREICGVEERKLAVSLQMFTDQDQSQLMNFWAKITNIPLKQFHRPYVRTARKGSYTYRSKYGTVLVGLDNIKLKKIIMNWLEEYKKFLFSNAGVAQLVEQRFCKPKTGGSTPFAGF